MKGCRLCSVEKSRSEFALRATARDGLRNECKACWRERARAFYYENTEHCIARARRYVLKRRYGMTPADWEQMLIVQAGRCGVCEKPMTGKQEPHVDHDHDTKKVRGMLCNNCNTSIGRLGDNVAGLERALAYLKAAA